KQNKAWIGYKVHLTETCDDDAPHLIVHAETTAATTPDWVMTEPIHRALAARECLPRTHILDGGYVDGDALVRSQTTYGIELLGPVPLENSWQAKAEQGFDLPHFHIKWEEQTVTCPVGKQSRSWTPVKDRFEQDAIYVKFDAADCQTCPCRADCTHAKRGPRGLSFLFVERRSRGLLHLLSRKRSWLHEGRGEFANTVSFAVSVFLLAAHLRFVWISNGKLLSLVTDWPLLGKRAIKRASAGSGL